MATFAELVRQALDNGWISDDDARRYLAKPTPPKQMWLVPATPPPVERIVPVRRPDGRIRRVRQSLTRRLVAAGLIDPAALKAPKPHPPQQQENSA